MGEETGRTKPRRRAIASTSSPRRAGPVAKDSRQRAAKLIARAGLCSRREAEALIAEGRVAVNGTALTNPAVNIKHDDQITVDGSPLAPRARTRLFLFHKPRGLVTTARDPQGRPTIFDYLRENWPQGPRVVTVGRLDINSEGLLLLTNDGGLARILALPATGWIRRYRVRARGGTSQAILDGLRDGATIAGVTYAGIEAKLDRLQGANCWLTMALREGKNREIKRVLESIGLMVNRLIRISYGPFQLGDLGLGEVEEVRTRVLRDQLGPKLATAAGVDFSSPLFGPREPQEAASSLALDLRSALEPRLLPPPRPFDPPAAVRSKPPPRRRKHISASRAAREENSKLRKRIAHGETADRAGRTIPVERLISGQIEAAPGKRRNKKPAGFRAGGPMDSRENAPPRSRGKTASSGRAGPRTGSQKPRRPRRKS
jgi:23S rRNA pseudouridine2605 synthase